MKLFHGSTLIIKNPVVLKKQRLLDFGNGFYTTTNQNQAVRWATIKKKRSKKTKSIITIFQIQKDLFSNQKYKIKKFSRADEEWLDFVLTNRKTDKPHKYDIIIGQVANDTLYATLSLYEANILTKKETINRLKVHKLYDQISFHNKSVLKELLFFDAYENSNFNT